MRWYEQSLPNRSPVVLSSKLFVNCKRFAQSAGPWFLVSFVSVVGVVFVCCCSCRSWSLFDDLGVILRSFLNALGTHGVSFGALRPLFCC